MESLNVNGYLFICVIREVELKNEFLNKVKNSFDFFYDFTVVSEKKKKILEDYINVKVSLLQDKHNLTLDESLEFEKKMKSYTSKKVVEEFKKYEKINSERSDQFIKEFNKRRNDMEGDAPNIPKVNWEDVGGHVDAKKDIIDTILLPQKFPELFNSKIGFRRG